MAADNNQTNSPSSNPIGTASDTSQQDWLELDQQGLGGETLKAKQWTTKRRMVDSSQHVGNIHTGSEKAVELDKSDTLTEETLQNQTPQEDTTSEEIERSDLNFQTAANTRPSAENSNQDADRDASQSTESARQENEQKSVVQSSRDDSLVFEKHFETESDDRSSQRDQSNSSTAQQAGLTQTVTELADESSPEPASTTESTAATPPPATPITPGPVPPTPPQPLPGEEGDDGAPPIPVESSASVPTLKTGDSQGLEDTAIAIELSSSLTDTDGSESLSITIEGIPTGATLSAGQNLGNGTWELTSDELTNLTLSPPTNSDEDFSLTITATSTESNGGATKSVSEVIDVFLEAVADTPILETEAATGDEDTAITLNIDVALIDIDGSETLSAITITGVPAEAQLSAGNKNNDGSWSLSQDDLEGLQITPGQDSNNDFDLNVSVATTDSNGSTATSDTILPITINAVADTAVITGTGDSVSEDILQTATGRLTVVDPDADEAHFDSEIIEGTYGSLTIDGDGEWTYSLNNEADGVQNLDTGDIVTDTITVTSADGTTHDLVMTVNGTNDAPVIDTITATAATEDGSVITGAITASDIDADDSVTFSAAETDGLSFNSDGSFSFDPSHESFQHLSEGDTQTVSIAVTATDEHNATDGQNLIITITGTNDAPTVSGAVTLPGGTEDSSQSFTTAQLLANADDIDTNDTLSVENVSVDPSQGVLTDNNDGTFTFTPKADFNGDVTINYNVTDGIESVQTTAAINLNATADDAVITGTGSTVTEDLNQTATGRLTIVDPDADEAHFSSEIIEGTYGSLTVDGDGEWTYSLNNEADGVQNLDTGDIVTDTITVTSADGTTHDLVMTVNGTNDAPVIDTITATAATEDGSVITGAITASDIDADDSVTFSAAETDGLSFNSDGSFSFDPSHESFQHLSEGDTQTVSIAVTATDKHNATDGQNLIITITGTNDAPTVSGAVTLPGGTEDSSQSFTTAQLLANADDIDTNDTLSVENVSVDPSQGVLTDNNDGTFTFTPKADFNGDVTLNYDVTDGSTSVSAIAGINLEAVNDAPVIRNAQTLDISEESMEGFSGYGETWEGDVYSVITQDEMLEHLGITDVDSDTFTVSLADAEVAWHDGIQANDSVFTSDTLSSGSARGDESVVQVTQDFLDNYPNIDAEVGDFYFDHVDFDNLSDDEIANINFSVQVSDGTGSSEAHDFKIQVTGSNDAPTISGTVILPETTEDNAQTFTTADLLANTEDIDANDTLTVSNVSVDPAHGSLTSNPDGTFTFEPKEHFSGEDIPISFNVSDGHVELESEATLSVTAVADAPDLQVSIGEPSGTPTETSHVTASGDVEQWTGQGIKLHGFHAGSEYESNNVLQLDNEDTDSVMFSSNYGDGLGISGGEKSQHQSQIEFVGSGTDASSEALVLELPGTTSEATIGLTAISTGNWGDSGQWTAYDTNGVVITTGDVTNNQAGTATSFTITTETPFQYIAFTAQDDGGIKGVNSSDFKVSSIEADISTGTDETSYPLAISSNLTDTDGSESLTITIADLPDGATLSAGTENADGSWTLSSDQLDGLELTTSSAVTETFDLQVTATATESSNSDQASVSASVAVIPANQAPVGTDDSATTGEDNSITVNVLDNDTDSNNDSLTITAVNPPTDADGNVVGSTEIVTENGVQQVKFTPNGTLDALNEGESSNIQFTYTVSDGQGGTDTATTTIEVQGTDNDLTYISETAGYRNVVGTYEIDGDGNPVSGTVVIDDQNGMAGGTHLADLEPGNYEFFIIADGAGEINDDSVISFDNSGDRPVLLINGDPTSHPVYYTEPGFNPDGKDHFQFKSDGEGGTYINIEDLPDLGDADFGDVVLHTNFEMDDRTAVGSLSDSDQTVNSVAENVVVGTYTGITATAVDADGDAVSYSLSDDAGGRFTIDSETGKVTVAEGAYIDFESSTTHDITITATSSDGTDTTENYTINVDDVQENIAPDATDDIAAIESFELPEGGSIVSTQGATTVVQGEIVAEGDTGSSVDQWTFHHSGGPLTIDTLSESSENFTDIDGDGVKDHIDTMMRLFDNEGNQVAMNDDSKQETGDGSTNDFYSHIQDSYIHIDELPPGNYSLAIGSWELTEEEVINDHNDNYEQAITNYDHAQDTGPYQITLTGDISFEHDTPLSTNEDTALTITADTLLANDSDADGGTLSVIAVSEEVVDAEGNVVGTAAQNDDGDIVFTPGDALDTLTSGENKAVNFTYTVSDDQGGTDTATATITVEGTDNDLIYVSETAGYRNVVGTYEIDGDGNPVSGTVVIDDQNGMAKGTQLADLEPGNHEFFIIANGAGEISDDSVISFDNSGDQPVLLINGDPASHPVYYTEPGFNPDGKDHFQFESDGEGGTYINIEDLPDLGDADFGDVVLHTNFEMDDRTAVTDATVSAPTIEMSIGEAEVTTSDGDGLSVDRVTDLADVSASDATTSTSGHARSHIKLDSSNDVVDINGTATRSIKLGDGNNRLDIKDNAYDHVSSGSGKDSIDIHGYAKKSVKTGDDDDIVNIGRSAKDHIDLGKGNNEISIGTNSRKTITAGDGDDVVNIGGYSTDTITLGDGTNQVEIKGTSKGVESGSGDDTVIIGKGHTGGDIKLGGGTNKLSIGGTSQGHIKTGSGKDTVLVDGHTYKEVSLGANDDQLQVKGHTKGHIKTDDGNDIVNIEGTATKSIDLGEGDDRLQVDGRTSDHIKGGDGNDQIDIGEYASKSIDAGEGDDIVNVGSSTEDHVKLGDGNDELSIGTNAKKSIDTGKGDDTVEIGGYTRDHIRMGDGDDTLTIGGQIYKSADGGSGQDTIHLDMNKAQFDDGYHGADKVTNFETIALNDGTYKDGVFSDTITTGGEVTDLADISDINWSGGSSSTYSYEITFKGTSTDTDGSESLSSVTVTVPDGVTSVTDSDGNKIPVTNGSASIPITSGTAATITLVSATELNTEQLGAIQAQVTSTESNGGENSTAIIGGSGDDTIQGGSGTDTAVFSGNEADYNVVKNSDGSFTVQDKQEGRDGDDTVIDVEQFEFADNTVDAGDLTLSSKLIDGAVEGVEYTTTSGLHGFTDETGGFDFKDGDDVTFTIGGVTLGTATAEDVTTGQTFLQDVADVDRTDLNDEYLENMATFLQSIDENSNAYDGIVVTGEIREALADVTIDLQTATEEEVQVVVEKIGQSYVEEDAAMDHVEDMLVEHTDLTHEEFDEHIDDDLSGSNNSVSAPAAVTAEATDNAVQDFNETNSSDLSLNIPSLTLPGEEEEGKSSSEETETVQAEKLETTVQDQSEVPDDTNVDGQMQTDILADDDLSHSLPSASLSNLFDEPETVASDENDQSATDDNSAKQDENTQEQVTAQPVDSDAPDSSGIINTTDQQQETADSPEVLAEADVPEEQLANDELIDEEASLSTDALSIDLESENETDPQQADQQEDTSLNRFAADGSEEQTDSNGLEKFSANDDSGSAEEMASVDEIDNVEAESADQVEDAGLSADDGIQEELPQESEQVDTNIG